MTNYGEIRSEIQNNISIRRLNALISNENPDIQRAAIELFLLTLAQKQGQNRTEAEYTVEIRISMKSKWTHGDYQTILDLVLDNFSNVEAITITPNIVEGMEISSYLNGDSRPCMVTQVDSQKAIWVTDLPLGKAALAEGKDLSTVPAYLYTRRQKRTSGRRGWAAKGASINAINYSGLNFSGAVSKYDPHF